MTPVVLVPGLLCTAEVFGPQIPALWPYGPITIASTLSGDTIADMARAILATAPPRFALAGISMGGYISLEIMRQAPERVIKLALLDTSARPDTPEQTNERRAFVARARAGEFEALLSQSLPFILHPSRLDDPAMVALNVRMGRTVGVEAMARQQEAIIGRADSRPALGAISVPTLVMVGDSDRLAPPDRAQEIAAGIPGARLIIIPECGHAAPTERPDIVNRALVEWMEG